MDANNAPNYLTHRQVADRLGVHPTRIHAWVRGIRVGSTRVRLAAEVIGDRFRFTEEAVEVFLRDCRVAKLGPDAPDPRPETPTQANRRTAAARDELLRVCGRKRD